jgi:hypothetical protein
LITFIHFRGNRMAKTPTSTAGQVAASVAGAAVTAAAATAVSNVKADVKAEAASKPWVLVAASFVAGAIAAALIQHFLGITI